MEGCKAVQPQEAVGDMPKRMHWFVLQAVHGIQMSGPCHAMNQDCAHDGFDALAALHEREKMKLHCDT